MRQSLRAHAATPNAGASGARSRARSSFDLDAGGEQLVGGEALGEALAAEQARGRAGRRRARSAASTTAAEFHVGCSTG